MRPQKLVVMTALAAAMGAANVSALGLGEVKLYSSLNQPLMAEIELLQVQELNRTEILPNLASRFDFERAGVERPSGLGDLSFKTVVEESGKAVIQVTSSRPIQEPYLNFLLEVHWPSGRLLREYTLLLDPPAFSEQSPAPVRVPAIADYQPYAVEQEVPAGTGYLPVPEETYTDRAPTVISEQSSDSSQRYSSATLDSGDSYHVKRNDTLWEIARQVKPGDDLSVQQTMLAIQRDNPQAFMDNNINRLKSGEVLRIPDRRDIERMTRREAMNSVARQNREWYESQGQQFAQLDATRRTSAMPESQADGPDGQLNIVAADSSSGQGQDLGGDGSASNAAIQTELAMTREQLDKLTRENAELKSRLKDLDDQIATLKRLATLKDDQLAALQTQITQAEQSKAEAVALAQKDQSQGFMGMLSSNPLLLILLAIFPLGLVGWLLNRRRKEQQAMDMGDDGEDSDPVVLTPKPESHDNNPEEEALDFDEPLEIDESLLASDSDDQDTEQQTEDAISEADIYIAYGRFNQAADLLQQAIDVEPQRADLRLKLLEVHAENTDLENFREALSGLERLGGAEALRKAEVYKTRFPGEEFGGSAADSSQAVDDLADLELDLDEGDLDADDNDSAPPVDDLNLGDLDLGQEEDSGDDLPDIDLDDFDLDLNDEPEDPAAVDASAAFSEDGESSLEAAISNDDDLDFLSEDDEVATKLDLARAYMDMGDMDGARDILQEVMEQGSDEQKAEAKALLDQAG